MKLFSVSPDSAWLAMATPGLKKTGSICPQLVMGARGWSVTVDRRPEKRWDVHFGNLERGNRGTRAAELQGQLVVQCRTPASLG